MIIETIAITGRAFDDAGALNLTRVLTARQLRIVRLYARGLRVKEMAIQLNVKGGTVGSHTVAIARRLEVHPSQVPRVAALALGAITRKEDER